MIIYLPPQCSHPLAINLSWVSRYRLSPHFFSSPSATIVLKCPDPKAEVHTLFLLLQGPLNALCSLKRSLSDVETFSLSLSLKDDWELGSSCSGQAEIEVQKPGKSTNPVLSAPLFPGLAGRIQHRGQLPAPPRSAPRPPHPPLCLWQPCHWLSRLPSPSCQFSYT